MPDRYVQRVIAKLALKNSPAFMINNLFRERKAWRCPNPRYPVAWRPHCPAVPAPLLARHTAPQQSGAHHPPHCIPCGGVDPAHSPVSQGGIRDKTACSWYYLQISKSTGVCLTNFHFFDMIDQKYYCSLPSVIRFGFLKGKSTYKIWFAKTKAL